MSNLPTILSGFACFTTGQALIWFQLNSQFVWEFWEEGEAFRKINQRLREIQIEKEEIEKCLSQLEGVFIRFYSFLATLSGKKQLKHILTRIPKIIHFSGYEIRPKPWEISSVNQKKFVSI